MCFVNSCSYLFLTSEMFTPVPIALALTSNVNHDDSLYLGVNFPPDSFRVVDFNVDAHRVGSVPVMRDFCAQAASDASAAILWFPRGHFVGNSLHG
jgi:hypothetical protein